MLPSHKLFANKLCVKIPRYLELSKGRSQPIIRWHFFTRRVINLWNSLPVSDMLFHPIAILQKHKNSCSTVDQVFDKFAATHARRLAFTIPPPQRNILDMPLNPISVKMSGVRTERTDECIVGGLSGRDGACSWTAEVKAVATD